MYKDMQHSVDMIFESYDELSQYRFSSAQSMEVTSNSNDDSNIIFITKQLLRNQVEVLANQNVYTIGDYFLSQFLYIIPEILLSIIKLDELVSIQCMSMPTDKVYTMQVTNHQLPNREYTNHKMQVFGQSVQALSYDLPIITNPKDVNTLQPDVISQMIINTFMNTLVCYAKDSSNSCAISILSDNFNNLSVDTINQLKNQFTIQSNKIASGNYRRLGNKIVTSLAGVEVLQQVYSSDQVMVKDRDKYIVYDDSDILYEVYCNNSIGLGGITSKHIQFMFGYRGKNSVDSGVVYAPHVLLEPVLQINDTTFAHEMKLVTKFGAYFSDQGTLESQAYNVLTIDCSN